MDPEEKHKHIKQIKIIKKTERTLNEATVKFTKGLKSFHQKKSGSVMITATKRV